MEVPYVPQFLLPAIRGAQNSAEQSENKKFSLANDVSQYEYKRLRLFSLGEYGGFEIFSFLFCDGCKKNKCNLFLFLSGVGFEGMANN
jgi:hypothetical protein